MGMGKARKARKAIPRSETTRRRGRPPQARPASFARAIVVPRALWAQLKRQARAEWTNVSALLARLATDYLNARAGRDT